MTLIERLTQEFGEGWIWDSDTLHCSGESSDGIPEWTIVDGKYGYWVTFELGSYEQHGEAENIDDLISLMHGMGVASDALDEHFRLEREKRK